MLKIIEINALETGSTGKIMLGIAEVARKNGFEVYTIAGKRKAKQESKTPTKLSVSSLLNYYFHRFLGERTGKSDFITFFSTWKLINIVKKISPDIIHLHVMHGCYVNNKILFEYLKTTEIPIIWTFHDCWAFTGRCPHFTVTQCNKWMVGCTSCVYPPNYYPISLIDHTEENWVLKKELFTSIKNMVIVTPSVWLGNLVRQSFLKKYEVRTINNGIDLTIFKPQDSQFRQEHGLVDKYIVLGVANKWNYRKGLDTFICLSCDLSDEYKIVLVGVDDFVLRQLPDNILAIKRTNNQKELAEIYSCADLFVNPTREDNFPTVNIEALACGTPVLTYDTGGSPEPIDNLCGRVVPSDDYRSLYANIIEICKEHPYMRENCINRARAYDMNRKFLEYVQLYSSMMEKKK